MAHESLGTQILRFAQDDMARRVCHQTMQADESTDTMQADESEVYPINRRLRLFGVSLIGLSVITSARARVESPAGACSGR